MLIALFTLCVFGLIFSLIYTNFLFFTRSRIREKLTIDPTENDTEPFFEVMWGYQKSGITQEKAFRYATLTTGGCLIIGLFFSIGIAFIFAIAGFILGPRIIMQYQKRRLIKQFNVQFPRAIASFSAAAKVMPLGKCFEHIAEEMPSPSKEVFAYISTAINQTNLNVAHAVRNAADQYELPELNGFAEALQILSEIGGGEEATALLDAVADETRFKKRHELEVKSIFGELQATMIASTIIPVLLLLYFMSDPSGIHAHILKTAPWLIVAGFVVLAVGWFVSRSLIRSATKTL